MFEFTDEHIPPEHPSVLQLLSRARSRTSTHAADPVSGLETAGGAAAAAGGAGRKDGAEGDSGHKHRPVGDVTRSGLLRKTGGSVKTWNTRWCVVKGQTLSYYTPSAGGGEPADGDTPRGTIPLAGATVEANVTDAQIRELFASSSGKSKMIRLLKRQNKKEPLEHCFGARTVDRPDRLFVFQAANDDERQQWVDSLRMAADNMLHANPMFKES